MDETMRRDPGETAAGTRRHRTMVIVVAVAALALLAAAWLVAAPAAGALAVCGASF